MPTLERRLDESEVFNIGVDRHFTVKYSGDVDDQALLRAFELLCRCHPVLRARIQSENEEYVLRVPLHHECELTVVDGDESTLCREVSRPWDPSAGVAQLVLVRGIGSGFVSLRVDHTVADGRALIAMLHNLWELYTDIVDGSVGSVGPGGSLPWAPHRLLEQRWGGIPPLKDRLGPFWSMRSSGIETTSNRVGRPQHVGRRIHLNGLRIQLSENETARLIASARAHRTSVNALLCGVIVSAQRAQHNAPEPTQMMCKSAIDLRNRVRPPVEPTESTNFIAAATAVVSAALDVDAIEVGRTIKEQFDIAIDRHELRLPIDLSRTSPVLRTFLEPRHAIFGVTNVGAIPDFPQPKGVTFTDFLLTPISYPEGFAGAPTYAIYTYGARLTIVGIYSASFVDHEAEGIISEVTAQIEKVSRR